MSGQTRELRQLQQWMQAVIMHPAGVVDGIASPAAQSQIQTSEGDIESVIDRSQALTSIERLQVYGNAYFARLLEVLRDEFPAVRHAIGDEAFAGFALGYLQTYPSRSYTLADLSNHFSQYLRETRPPAEDEATGPDWIDFLIDLTVLEQIYGDVFSGEGPEGGRHLKPAELSQIPPDQWANVTLTPIPCLQLARFRFPVHEYSTAVRLHKDPTPPDAQETLLVVSRRDFIVRRQAVSRAEFEMLTAIVEGATLGDAIQRTMEATEIDFDSLAANIGEWFQSWAALQFFQSVTVRS